MAGRAGKRAVRRVRFERPYGTAGVACSLIPYFIIIRLITALVNGTAELTYCLTFCAWMAGFWVLRYVLHSVSTSLSHHATFHVLANTRVGCWTS